MSRLTELIAKVGHKDPALADELSSQVKSLMKRLDFGLNFERHVPESIELPGRRIRRGDKVRWLADRKEPAQLVDDRVWLVTRITSVDGVRTAALVECDASDEQATTTRPVCDLVSFATFRDSIYPGLRSSGSVSRGGDKAFHAVINADNFHALEALRFAYENQVDAIYIDPPYNTRDKDWKYNNDYVDSDDAYKHSKWLAFMERRLSLAKHLLKTKESVLIITIDENEVHRLALLLEQLSPGSRRQMVTTVTSQRGVAREGMFSRVDEYLLFVFIGEAQAQPSDRDFLDSVSAAKKKQMWFQFRRNGEGSLRTDSPNLFYPLFVEPEARHVVSIGDPLPRTTSRKTVKPPEGCVAIWPLREDGTEARWRTGVDRARVNLSRGLLRVAPFNEVKGVWPVLFVTEGGVKAIDEGEVRITGHAPNGDALLAVGTERGLVQPKTVWNMQSHDAGWHGSRLLGDLLPNRRFPYSKSLYAVEDALRLFVGNKPTALVMDFFSGSGTTAHAVMRLNRQDGGTRRSVLVTNNEVSHAEASALRAAGYRPGDPEWEAQGICHYITQPRLRAAVTGKTPEGKFIGGSYGFVDEFPISEGFQENVEFFDLTFEDSNEVQHNLAFSAIAPLLWMRAGCKGRRIDRSHEAFDVADTYGVLFNIDAAAPFIAEVRSRRELVCAFVVTDSQAQYQVIADELPGGVEPIRLYEAYLRSVEITMGED